MHVTLKYVTVATELAGNISGEAHACMPAAEYIGVPTPSSMRAPQVSEPEGATGAMAPHFL